MKKILFIALFLTSCGNQNLKTSENYLNINFDRDYTLVEFKKILDIYNKKQSFPDIDN